MALCYYRRMKRAVSIPNFGPFADLPRLVQLAREAEDNGWDGFFTWDHLNEPPQETLDPWVALAAISTATSRIRLGTMITPLPRAGHGSLREKPLPSITFPAGG